MRGAAAVLCVLAAASACKEPGWSTPELSYDLVQLASDRMVLVGGDVGEVRWKTRATYVLVEARSSADQDAMVTLTGELRDAQGKAVGRLRKESLRVPAGGSRVFALVEDQQREVAGATTAHVVVVGAMPVGYEAPVVVKDGRVFKDGDRAVVGGNVVNTANRPASAIVLAAFFDDKGAPMSRPSTLFKLDGESKRGIQVVGPPGSVSASLFVGEVTY